MKIALVHDYLKEYGGAERVLEVLRETWPEAPIYTLVYLPKFLGPHQQRIKNWDVRPIIPSWFPFLEKMISPLRLVAPILFSRLDLSNFDIVIVSATGAYNPNLIKTKPGAHICYCHTPPRYLYGLPTAREWKKHWWIRIPSEIANHFLRMVDFKSAQNVDFFIANSKNTAGRIKKFYRKDSTVIYPPIEIKKILALSKKTMNKQKRTYFLAGGRLARAKRIDLAISACTRLNLSLKVFGKAFAGYKEELKQIAGPTVEFVGEVNDEELIDLYANCRAFLFCNLEEDFGMIPVEVMAAGRPVIALRSGGVVESVVEGKTGIFFEEPTVDSLVGAIKDFEKIEGKIKPEDCQKQAEKFSKEKFKEKIAKLVEENA